jgi:hypothetical protein
MGSYPYLPIFKFFLLPNRHYLLNRVDNKLAGGKRLRPVGGRYGHYYGYMADFQGAFAVYDGYSLEHGPFLLGLLGYKAHLVQSHSIVGLVVQAHHGPPRRLVADGADKGVNGASAIGFHGGNSGGYVDGLVGKFNEH